MKTFLISFLILTACAVSLFAQKGIDSQTKKIKEEARKNITGNDVSRSWSWGKDKTIIRKKLPNPYRMNSRRDILINIILGLLKDNKLIVDEAASKFKSGLLVTQPYVFSKGAILTKNELSRYAVIPARNTIWTRGRFTMTIDIRSIDGMKNDIAVTAKIEGRSRNGLFSEWLTLNSSGTAEDEFLAKLIDRIGGGLPKGERRP